MSSLYCVADPWCRYLPLLHRLLADPTNEERFPAVAADLPLEEACAVWETLHYLLCTLLGWNDPGAGLSWWYAHGKPTENSPLLAAVVRWWGHDEEALDLYAAWACEQGHHGFEGDGEGRAVDSPSSGRFVNAHWWEAFRRRSQPAGHNPYYGGDTPLHLGHSDTFGFDEAQPDRVQWHLDPSARQAVLIVNNLGTWRGDLRRLEEYMPAVGERSWHVEVFDRQVGYLGLYRRSHVSGRWFQGKHSVHVRGQRLVVKEVRT